jgi:hypothetical protein
MFLEECCAYAMMDDGQVRRTGSNIFDAIYEGYPIACTFRIQTTG